MKKPNKKRQAVLLKEWDSENVGRPVMVRKDDGTEIRTTTASKPWLLGGHTAVILVEGISGCYSLERVRMVAPETVGEFRVTNEGREVPQVVKDALKRATESF